MLFTSANGAPHQIELGGWGGGTVSLFVTVREGDFTSCPHVTSARTSRLLNSVYRETQAYNGHSWLTIDHPSAQSAWLPTPAARPLIPKRRNCEIRGTCFIYPAVWANDKSRAPLPRDVYCSVHHGNLILCGVVSSTLLISRQPPKPVT